MENLTISNLSCILMNHNASINLLILPGWGEKKEAFITLASKITNANCYLIDLPGFGQSPIGNDLSMKGYALKIKEIIEERKLTHVVLVGHSFGGLLTMVYCRYFMDSRIERIILISPAGMQHPSLIKKVKLFSYKVLQKFTKNEEAKAARYQRYASKDYLEADEKHKIIMKNSLREPIHKYIKKVEIPVLLLCGKKDTITPLKSGYLYKRKLVHSQMIVCNYSSHFCFLEEPIKVLASIEYFLGGVKC